ncbi:MAG: PEP-CTERM sorting domain-containing protein [Isosphaeraceae bacterium]
MPRIFVLSSLLAALAATMTTTAAARADFYSAAADFSVSSNPNGVWSYGYSTTLTGAFIPNDHSGNPPFFPGTPFQTWYTPISPLGDPLAGVNDSDKTITLNGSLVIQPHQLVFHPGPNGEFEKIRFTSPAAGLFAVNALFGGADTTPTSTDVHVLLNGVSLFDGVVNAFGAGPAFSTPLNLKAGDTLDFAVGYGGNRDYGFDSTSLAATISTVPEPSSLVALGAGALCLAAFFRRVSPRAST